MNLLFAHIRRLGTTTGVYSKHSWSKDVPQSEHLLLTRLREVDPAFPRDNGLVFLLFDEAQDSYGDELLWNYFFKGVADGDYPHYRVILFCSYGSPSSRPVDYHIGTPLVMRDTARISLWPTKGSIGILLDHSEFDEVVSRFERPLNLHSDLRDSIFNWTVGHVGAVVELLRLISNQVSIAEVTPESFGSPNSCPQRGSKTRLGEQFTVTAFCEENPMHILMGNLRGGAFGRGLPQDKELATQPAVVALFRKILRDGIVEETGSTNEATSMCHRNGWIHSFFPDQQYQTGILYAFASPLHAACLSWRLTPTNDIPNFDSILHLSLMVISAFKPSQLNLPIRRIGTQSTDTPPEAQYQDEFYRSLFLITHGNVRISPEFASAKKAQVLGRIYFFIPSVKWGIEITQDGNRLKGHNSRFEATGAYGA
jgi:hypothetical protein